VAGRTRRSRAAPGARTGAAAAAPRCASQPTPASGPKSRTAPARHKPIAPPPDCNGERSRCGHAASRSARADTGSSLPPGRARQPPRPRRQAPTRRTRTPRHPKAAPSGIGYRNAQAERSTPHTPADPLRNRFSYEPPQRSTTAELMTYAEKTKQPRPEQQCSLMSRQASRWLDLRTQPALTEEACGARGSFAQTAASGLSSAWPGSPPPSRTRPTQPGLSQQQRERLGLSSHFPGAVQLRVCVPLAQHLDRRSGRSLARCSTPSEGTLPSGAAQQPAAGGRGDDPADAEAGGDQGIAADRLSQSSKWVVAIRA